MYSFGAPDDQSAWNSTDYFEVMYSSGVIDARGHTDRGYWRSQTTFGAAAQYYGVGRETAEMLDCVMDRVLVKTPSGVLEDLMERARVKTDLKQVR